MIVDSLQIEAAEDGLVLHEVGQLVTVEVQGPDDQVVVNRVHLETNFHQKTQPEVLGHNATKISQHEN